MTHLMNPHKKSGKDAHFQTRDEAAKEALARNTDGFFDPANVHEIVRQGDTFKMDGNDVLHKPAALTAEDIRIVVPNDDGTYVYIGPWNKSAEKDKMQKDWDAAN